MAGLQTTLELLSRSTHSAAAPVLAAGLREESPRWQRMIVEALLKRGSVSAMTELIRHREHLHAEAAELFEAGGHELDVALAQCIEHGNEQLQANALRITRDGDRVEVLPRLVECLLVPRLESPEMVEVLAELAETLYDMWFEATRLHRGDATKYEGLRVRCVTALDTLIASRETSPCIGTAIHLMLMLGDIEEAAVKRLLWRSSENLRTQAGEFLVISRHPGVMSKVLQSLATRYPHPRAFDAVRYRTDPEFIGHLLSKFPRKLTVQKQSNLRQIDSVAWLEPDWFELALIPEPLQPALVRFVAATGLPRESKSYIYEIVLREGTAEARSAAAEFDSVLDQHRRREIIDEGLESGDSSLQLWAISQLRKYDDPDSFARLIESLDSSDPVVAEAARKELSGFDLHHVLSLVGKRNQTICRRAGALLLKIHPEAPEQLAAELRHPIRQKRIQGINAVRSLGLATPLCAELIRLLEDPDAYVRQTAVAALSEVPAPEVLEALERVRHDPSRRVRDAVAEVLHALGPQVDYQSESAERFINPY